MEKVSKALGRLTVKEREKVKEILVRLKNGQSGGLDLKKLKGHEDIFRIRKGKLRIIYRIDNNGSIFILTIERRNDKTYNL